MSAGRIATEYEGNPNTMYITGRPAVGVLPDGRRLRLGCIVTGSFSGASSIRGAVIGWGPDYVVINPGDSSSIELRPQELLTIEETC